MPGHGTAALLKGNDGAGTPLLGRALCSALEKSLSGIRSGRIPAVRLEAAPGDFLSSLDAALFPGDVPEEGLAGPKEGRLYGCDCVCGRPWGTLLGPAPLELGRVLGLISSTTARTGALEEPRRRESALSC